MPQTHIDQLIEDFGYPEEHEDFYADWLYGAEDSLFDPADYAVMNATPHPDTPSERIAQSWLYPDERDRKFSEDDLPIILEMPSDSGGNEWITDPIGKHGFGEGGWVRTTQTIPPDEIKVFAHATPDMTVGQFLDMIAEKHKEMGFR